MLEAAVPGTQQKRREQNGNRTGTREEGGEEKEKRE